MAVVNEARSRVLAAKAQTAEQRKAKGLADLARVRGTSSRRHRHRSTARLRTPR